MIAFPNFEIAAHTAWWCEERVPAFAVPRYVEVVAELPKTPTGKIQKHLLRDQGISEHTWDSLR